jgi:hypothetical protein
MRRWGAGGDVHAAELWRCGDGLACQLHRRRCAGPYDARSPRARAKFIRSAVRRASCTHNPPLHRNACARCREESRLCIATHHSVQQPHATGTPATQSLQRHSPHGHTTSTVPTSHHQYSPHPTPPWRPPPHLRPTVLPAAPTDDVAPAEQPQTRPRSSRTRLHWCRPRSCRNAAGAADGRGAEDRDSALVWLLGAASSADS